MINSSATNGGTWSLITRAFEIFIKSKRRTQLGDVLSLQLQSIKGQLQSWFLSLSRNKSERLKAPAQCCLILEVPEYSTHLAG